MANDKRKSFKVQRSMLKITDTGFPPAREWQRCEIATRHTPGFPIPITGHAPGFESGFAM